MNLLTDLVYGLECLGAFFGCVCVCGLTILVMALTLKAVDTIIP